MKTLKPIVHFVAAWLIGCGPGILALCLCGCDPQHTAQTNGTDIITTNGAVYRHTFSHVDRYYFLSNAIPQ